MKYFNYSHLLRQRAVLIGLTLGLATVFLGMLIELGVSSQKTTISPAVQRLITPLNPQLDVKTVEKIESYPQVTIEEARRSLTNRRPAIVEIPEEVVPDVPASSSGETVPLLEENPPVSQGEPAL